LTQPGAGSYTAGSMQRTTKTTGRKRVKRPGWLVV